MLVSRALLRFSFFRFLRQYLAHIQDSLSLDCYISYSRTFRILFHGIVTLVSRALLGFSFMDCYVSISRTFRILFDQIVALVCHALLGFSFIRVLRQYLTYFQDPLLLNCYVSISCTFRILFHWIVNLVSRLLLLFFFCLNVTFVSCALLGFSLIELSRQYLAHFQDSLSLDCYVSISRTFRILFHQIVTLVSHALLGFSLIGLLRQ